VTDIVIRRCTLRVVRHGGWSWGADRSAVLERATQALPRLIAARLAQLLEAGDGEIDTVLRLRVPLRAAQWRSEAGIADAIAVAIKAEALPEGILHRAAMPPAIDATTASPIEVAASSHPQTGTEAEQHAAAETPLALLLRWRAQGDLPRRLRAFSLRALDLWLEAALDDAPVHPVEAAQPVSFNLALAERVYAGVAAIAEPATARAVTRLILVLEAIVRQGRPPDAVSLLARIDAILPGAAPVGDLRDPAQQLGRDSGRDKASAAVPGADDTRTAVTPLRGRARPIGIPDSEIALASVLPFLVLGALARIGWMEMAAAAIRALALPDDGAVFAAALALKAMPGHGRLGTAELQRTAAAFAGLRNLPSPNAFRDWCRDSDGGLSPLAGFIAAEMANGHDSQQPLLICRLAGASWLLLDGDGRMPVAWEGDSAAILQRLAGFGPSVILVSAAAAEPALLRGLMAARRGFVTAAPPGRGENWRRLPGAAPRWAWSGDMPLPRLMTAARLLPELEATAEALTSALFAAGPATRSLSATPEGEALERIAALTAATGLGLLAWTLWRKRETVDPLLALQRLGDLDGTARVSADAIEIRPAIGRRYLDLREHRLLGDVRSVPWLAGRTIRFIGP